MEGSTRLRVGWLTRAGLVVVLSIPLLVAGARAQEVGTVAAIDGSAEIGRGRVWAAAAVGSPVNLGDELRTGRPGRLRVVFQDDSVLSLSEDSRVVVNEQVFDSKKGKARSLFNLLRGKVTSVVSEYYHQPGAAYEVKTPTAVAGVRGTEFAVEYYETVEVTQVIGIDGAVTVHSLVDPTGPGVLVTANEATTVTKGEMPTAPQVLDRKMFRQHLEGFDFIGSGRVVSPALSQAVGVGASVASVNRANAVKGPAQAAPPRMREKRDESSILEQSPAVIKAMTGQLGIGFPRAR